MQIMKGEMGIEVVLNFNPCQHGALRVDVRGAECSVALTKVVAKVAGVDDSLRAQGCTRTQTQMQTQHFLNAIPHTIIVGIHLQGVWVCVCVRVCICGFQSL